MIVLVQAQVLGTAGIITQSLKGELEGLKAHFFKLFHAKKLTELILHQIPTARTSSSLKSSPLQILLIGLSSPQVQYRHFLWSQLPLSLRL